MPAQYDIDRALRVVISKWTGVITFEDIRAHNHALESDPEFEADMFQFSDARGAIIRVDAAGVRRLARTSPFGPEARRAILVADEASFGVGRQYEAQANDAGLIGVFRDLTEACGWLGLARGAAPGMH